MAKVKGGQLGLVTKLYELAANAISGETELDDGHIDLVLPVVPEILRRSASPAKTTGLFLAVLENTHAAAGGLTVNYDPYFEDVASIPPWPNPIDEEKQEVWLLDAAGLATAGVLADFESGLLLVRHPAAHWGYGENDDLTAVTPAAVGVPVARWTSAATVGNVNVLLMASGEVRAPIGIRIRRHTIIQWRTLSDGAGVVSSQLLLTMGLFPAGMGQDILHS